MSCPWMLYPLWGWAMGYRHFWPALNEASNGVVKSIFLFPMLRAGAVVVAGALYWPTGIIGDSDDLWVTLLALSARSSRHLQWSWTTCHQLLSIFVHYRSLKRWASYHEWIDIDPLCWSHCQDYCHPDMDTPYTIYPLIICCKPFLFVLNPRNTSLSPRPKSLACPS